jgi:hypothetical protein
MRVRITVIAATSCLVFVGQALAQSGSGASGWSSTLRMYLPLVLLVVVWFVIWKGIGLGKGGYRKVISQNQERMSQIEQHLEQISRQLERIATWLEQSGKTK